jgi:hypothetical protein
MVNYTENSTLSNFIITNSGTGIGNSKGILRLNEVSVINSVNAGISNHFGWIIIKNSTVSNNGSSGIINSYGSTTIFNSTIANNGITSLVLYGGGISNTNGAVYLTNSIVANNFASQAPDCYNQVDWDNFLISNGYNILGSTVGCNITAATGDKFNVNPKLSPLLPLGYQALEPTSPAIHNGNPATCMQKDQRGIDRLTDAKCDIGAYEYTVPGAATSLFAVNPETMHATSNSAFIRPLKVVALDAAGAPVGGVSITFSAPTSGPSGKFSVTNATSTTAITDSAGLAKSSTLIAGTQTGYFTVNATASGIASTPAFNLHNGTWLVSPSGSNSNSCLDVSSPCLTIYGVLEKPEFMPGETVRLSVGLYPIPNTSPEIKKSVNIEGGWSSAFNVIEGVSEIKNNAFKVAVNNYSSVKVSRIDFSDGDGIFVTGNLVIENSSIRHQELGISNSVYGNLTLKNVTVSGGGLYYPSIRNEGILRLENTTVSGNQGSVTGGIDNSLSSTPVYIKNSIIAGNTGLTAVPYASVDCRGTFISLGNNIIGTIGNGTRINSSCNGSWKNTDALGNDNSPISISSILNPTLQLDLNSWVHPLMPGSLALNTGADCLPTDQRGVSRPQGNKCDIGSYEYGQLPPQLISGNAGTSGVTLSYVDGTPKTVVSAVDGSYSFSVPSGWSGTVTPTHSCFTFAEIKRTYVNVITKLTGQDYTAIFNSGSGCTAINVEIGGITRGTYGLPDQGSLRVNYAGLDSGPVVVESTNAVPIIAAIRDAWAVNGVTTSFSQLMGLPSGQVSDTYVFPAYNNVSLNEQLRIGNVDAVATTVTVTIGGILRGTYDLDPNEAVRINYDGLDSGPVIVEGTDGVDIIAAIREAWAVNGVTKSFVQLMGLPATQLSDKYVFPAYNNVTLNEQLRIGNVDTDPSTVTVTIGGILQGTYDLDPNEAVRINYDGLDSGPVIVDGTDGVNIIAAIRDAWQVNGVTTSFSQLMGMPAGGLSDTYIFPAYNNVTLNEQLRIGNVDTVATTVTVTIGGVLRGTYDLDPDEAVRINYDGLDSGPVVIQGTDGVDIISAIREAWAVNGVTQSFVQLMGLPFEQLSTTYLFPAYNNVTLNEQLRFAVP